MAALNVLLFEHPISITFRWTITSRKQCYYVLPPPQHPSIDRPRIESFLLYVVISYCYYYDRPLVQGGAMKQTQPAEGDDL